MERLTEFVNKSFEESKDSVSRPDREPLFVRHPQPGPSFNVDDDDDDDDDGADDESVDVCDIKEEDVTVDDDGDDDNDNAGENNFDSTAAGNDSLKSAGECVLCCFVFWWCVCVCACVCVVCFVSLLNV